MFSCSVFLRTCSARVEHSYFGPFEARKLCKVTAISVCMYNSPIGMTSITLHTRTKFMNCSAEHGKERCRWQHAMLSSALSHTTLQCGSLACYCLVGGRTCSSRRASPAPPLAAGGRSLRPRVSQKTAQPAPSDPPGGPDATVRYAVGYSLRSRMAAAILAVASAAHRDCPNRGESNNHQPGRGAAP